MSNQVSWQNFLLFLTSKANVVEVATGQVMGLGVGKTASSLTDDVLAPILTLLSKGGGNARKDYFWVIKKGPKYPYGTVADALADGAVVVNYGNVAHNIFNLFIQSLLLYLVLGVWTRCVGNVCRR
jgi:large conductance mechanosensitive channel